MYILKWLIALHSTREPRFTLSFSTLRNHESSSAKQLSNNNNNKPTNCAWSGNVEPPPVVWPHFPSQTTTKSNYSLHPNTFSFFHVPLPFLVRLLDKLADVLIDRPDEFVVSYAKVSIYYWVIQLEIEFSKRETPRSKNLYRLESGLPFAVF